MLYQLAFQDKYQKAQIETWDGVVVQATPSMRWAIGKQIAVVIFWLNRRGIKWKQFHGKPSRSLTGVPSDSEIYKRTSP